MKAKSGSVVLTVDRGKLRIQFPRALFDGQQKYLALGLPDTPINRAAAEARVKQIESDIAFDRFDHTLERYRVQALTTNGVNLAELWQRYTQHKSKELAVTTIEKDFKRVANHIAQCPVKTIAGVPSARRVRSYLQSNTTPATTRKMLMHLRACCDWATDEGLLMANPFVDLKVSSRGRSREPQPFSRDEMEQIIKAFGEHPQYAYYTPFVRFLFLTGCRTSEAVGLRWSDVGDRVITFSSAIVNGHRKGTKTGTIREFPINAQLSELLAGEKGEGRTGDRLVFLAPKGGAIDPHNFLNRAWRGVLSGLSMPYRPQYSTRATFITLCLQSGVQVTQVAKWVGNSPRTIWQHYAGLVSSDSVPLL